MSNSPSTTASNKRLILVMGLSGAGKSSFINLLPVDHKLEVSQTGDLACCTKQVSAVTFQHNGLEVTMVDTVGSDHFHEDYGTAERDCADADTRDDGDAIKKLVAFLNDRSENGEKVSGVIYLHRITDNRMGGVAAQSLERFSALCGRDSMKNVVFLTNRWAKPSYERERSVHLANENTLKNKYLKTKVQGSDAIRFERLDDGAGPSEERAISILEHILQSPLQADISAVQQYRDATGDHKLGQTDLAKVINSQYERKAKVIERRTGKSAASVRKAQKQFMETTAREMSGYIAGWTGEGIFGPRGERDYIFLYRTALSDVAARIRGPCASHFEEVSKDQQQSRWVDPDQLGKKYAKIGKEVGGVAGEMVGHVVGHAKNTATALNMIPKPWNFTGVKSRQERQ